MLLSIYDHCCYCPSICEEKMRFRLDSMVQIVLQQGQVEVEAGDFIADYTNAMLIHRKIIEDLNSTIRVHGITHLISHYKSSWSYSLSVHFHFNIVFVHKPETKHKTKSELSSSMSVCTRNE